MATRDIDQKQLHELLYQALETELGGVQVYETALECAINEDLRKEWQEYLRETRHHVQVVTRLVEGLGLDPTTETPGRAIVRHLGESLVMAMRMALEAGDRTAAQCVATECVVLAETKDHANWEMIGVVAEKGRHEGAALLKQAHDEVEKQEDHHLYHTRGWSRELWIESLGLPAVLPPPEEIRKVESAIGAAQAEQQRDQMRKH
jgi:rubrerythrin